MIRERAEQKSRKEMGEKRTVHVSKGEQNQWKKWVSEA